jgi:hypothetical protein
MEVVPAHNQFFASLHGKIFLDAYKCYTFIVHVGRHVVIRLPKCYISTRTTLNYITLSLFIVNNVCRQSYLKILVA